MSLWREPESRPVDGGSPELIFELEWKKAARTCGKRDNVRASIGIWDPPDPTLDLVSFKSYLCQNLGVSGDVAVSYIDSDGDELPIDSECEFREALKFARAQTKVFQNVLLMIDKTDKHVASNRITSKQSSPTSGCEGLFVMQGKSTDITSKSNMAAIPMPGIPESSKKRDEIVKMYAPVSSSASSETIPPAWFKSYMETLKNDIVKEVSTKVMTDVMGAINKNRFESCPSCSHAISRSRHSRETNTEEKQHRKKKKRVVEEVESSDTFSPPQQPDVQLLRKVKKIEKRERNLQRKLDHKLERLEQMTRIIVETKNRCHDVAAIAKNLDKGCKLTEPSVEPIATSASPQDVQAKDYEVITMVSSCNEGRARMNCSVTGHEMLEKPMGTEIAYESDSDSDNISIISGVSNVSDLDHDYNFELIQTPPCFILDKPLNIRESQSSKAPEKLDNSSPTTPEQQDFHIISGAESDRNNNRDSPSYEVLSGPTTSASCSPPVETLELSWNVSKQSANKDLIDLTLEDFALDSQEQNIVDQSNELTEMSLDKRPGGAYSFVNETLPIHVKEAIQMSKSETNSEQFTEDNCNLNLNMKSSHPSYETKERISHDKTAIPVSTHSQSTYGLQSDLASGTNHESTHSFSSHTSRATVGNTVYNLTQSQTRATHTGPKYTVVDHNVSKGLGDMKYSSYENNLGARGCQAKREEQTNDKRGKYQRGFTSEGSACVFTEQPQKSSPESGTRESSPEFGRVTNDSVHILPETLVSGAVTVASNAYSTACKVFDKIRKMQTGDDQGHVENAVPVGSDLDGYLAVLEEMGFTNMAVNARFLSQFNYDMSRVISELVQ